MSYSDRERALFMDLLKILYNDLRKKLKLPLSDRPPANPAELQDLLLTYGLQLFQDIYGFEYVAPESKLPDCKPDAKILALRPVLATRDWPVPDALLEEWLDSNGFKVDNSPFPISCAHIIRDKVKRDIIAFTKAPTDNTWSNMHESKIYGEEQSGIKVRQCSLYVGAVGEMVSENDIPVRGVICLSIMVCYNVI